MKKKILLLLACISALGLGACKQKEDPTLKVFLPPMVDDNGTVLPVYQKLIEASGVKVQPMVSKGTTAAGLDSLIAAKNYPDMINLTGATDLEGYIKQGFAQPLDDLIKQYAPNIQKLLDDNASFRKQVTYKDGKIYNIGSFDESQSPLRYTYYIRQDWLSKYNAANGKAADWQPKSADLTNLFTWWADNITTYDGEGKATDAKPIMYVSEDSTSTHQNFPNLVGLFGVNYWFYATEETEYKVKFAPYDQKEGWLNALSEIKVWWENNWIDHEQFTEAGTEFFTKYLVNSDRAGIIAVNGIDNVENYNKVCKAVNPECNLVPLTPPGDYLWDTAGTKTWEKSGFMITTTASKAKQIEAIKLLDAGFTEAGKLLLNYGIEGENYTVNAETGRPVLKEGFLPGDLNGVRCYANFPTVYNDALDTEDGQKSEFAKLVEKVNSPYVINTVVTRPSDRFFRTKTYGNIENTEDADWLKGKLSQVRQPVIDAYAMKIITGQANTTTDYDQFKADLESYDFTRIIALQQAGLDVELAKILAPKEE